jgi:hypothetical protein
MSTELTVVERAVIALGQREHEQELIALAASTSDIIAITNSDGYKQVHAARMALVSRRVQIQKLAKDARDDATQFSKACIAEEKRLVALIQPEELRLDALETAHDKKIAAEKQARIDAELKRIADIQQRIGEIRDLAKFSAAAGPGFIEPRLVKAEAIVIDESFAEFAGQAQDAKTAAVAGIKEMLAAAVQRAADQEELAKLRAANAKRETEERARQESIDRQTREEQRIRDEAERAAREKHESALAEIRSIDHQMVIAITGRPPHVKGRTLEGIDILIAETEGWTITEEKFGVLLASAEAVRTSTISRLKDLREKTAKALDDARLESEKREREADTVRVPVVRFTRPSDAEIIKVLADHYGASIQQVTEWLMRLDLRALAVA